MDTRQQTDLIIASMCRQTELYGEWAKKNGMSYNRMMILYVLDRGGGCTQTQITQGWMIPKQTVNTVVKELERKGCVRLQAGRDQKEKQVCLTESGKALAREKLEELYQIEERAMAAIGPDLCQALVDANLAFAEALAAEVHRG